MIRSRRRLLACLPALPLSLPDAARAFRQETAPPDFAREVAGRCGPDEGGAGLHALLRQELARRLDGGFGSAEALHRLAARLRCPSCGCAIAPPPG